MIQGSSHARTARSAAGHERCGRGCGVVAVFFPARVLGGSGVRFGWLVAAWTGTALVIPAEGEGAADQVPVAPDGTITSHLIVTPAQRPFGLLVALLDPVPQAIQPH